MKSEPYRFYPSGMPGITLDPKTVEALLQVNAAADLKAAILHLGQFQLKLLKHPAILPEPKREEILGHVQSHLFFLEKTEANFQKSIAGGSP
ncbi:MAG: hypothetical protein QMC96_12215 [Methanomicrobiales archaeon]|nr:hypothetical protein [Methanomicrobiales archaeon]